MIKKQIKPLSILPIKPIFRSPGVFTMERDTQHFVQYEPRRRNRWMMEVEDHKFIISTDGTPSREVDYDEISIRNNIYRMPSRYNWTPITCKILDVVGLNSSIDMFRDWMLSDAGKKQVRLQQLDPTGVVVEEWLLIGTFIQEMRHEMVYDNTVGDVEIRLHYDMATIL